MSFSTLILISDYAGEHGIQPIQAQSTLYQLGKLPIELPIIIHSRAYQGRVLEVVI
jgi:hypothetical protein